LIAKHLLLGKNSDLQNGELPSCKATNKKVI